MRKIRVRLILAGLLEQPLLPNLLWASDIELEWLPVGVLRRSHHKNIADLVGKPDRYGQPVAVVACIIVDLGQTHDVREYRFEFRHVAGTSLDADMQRVGRLWPNVGIEAR